MSSERQISLRELNSRIDELLIDYRKELGTRQSNNSISPVETANFVGKIEALEELKIEINDPQAIVNISEKAQESINLITAKNIIDNGV